MERKRLSYIERFIFSKSVVWGIRLLIGGIFLYTGAVKAVNLHAFGEAIANYRIIPESLSVYAACLLSATEIILGLFFLLGVYVKETANCLVLLNVVFIVTMISAMARGIDISCGCFSSSGEVIGVKDIVRDVVFILLILIGKTEVEFGEIDS